MLNNSVFSMYCDIVRCGDSENGVIKTEQLRRDPIDDDSDDYCGIYAELLLLEREGQILVTERSQDNAIVKFMFL